MKFSSFNEDFWSQTLIRTLQARDDPDHRLCLSLRLHAFTTSVLSTLTHCLCEYDVQGLELSIERVESYCQKNEKKESERERERVESDE